MKPRIFLDTNVFIYAFEFPNSNSRLILDLLTNSTIECVISERVLNETFSYFKKYHPKDLASKIKLFLLESCTLVLNDDVKEEKEKWVGKIKDKDLEQLAVVKKFGLKHLVSYDRDFENFPEYTTPKEFAKLFNLKAFESEY